MPEQLNDHTNGADQGEQHTLFGAALTERNRCGTTIPLKRGSSVPLQSGNAFPVVPSFPVATPLPEVAMATGCYGKVVTRLVTHPYLLALPRVTWRDNRAEPNRMFDQC